MRALREGRTDLVAAQIEAVVGVAHAHSALVKVVLENAYLGDAQIVLGSRAAERAGADFVKTSTGFAPTGATVHDLVLMAGAVSPTTGIKAAGGVRTLDRLLEFVALGATRFGATATAAILDEARLRADPDGLLPVPAPPLEDPARGSAGPGPDY